MRGTDFPSPHPFQLCDIRDTHTRDTQYIHMPRREKKKGLGSYLLSFAFVVSVRVVRVCVVSVRRVSV